MAVALTIMYVVAAGLSAWGVVGPWSAARRREQYTKRADAEYTRLRETVWAADGTEDEPRARAKLEESLAAPFEGGPETLKQLTQTVVFTPYTSGTNAVAELRSRTQGLRWVVAGVIIGSAASILSLWFPPA